MNLENNVSISNKDNFQISMLQNYHRKGLAGRLGLIHLLVEQITKVCDSNDPANTDKNFGLNKTEKLNLLQCATVSYLMMTVEDIALLCISFMKNEPNYYKYLDGQGEEDLGKIIGKFYTDFELLTNDEIRKILSIVHPDEYEFGSVDERNVMVSSLLENIRVMRYFIGKTSVFYDSHIGIFRRFKHAGFPITFGRDTEKHPELSPNFESLSYAFTSRGEIEDELSVLPFSKKSIDSYLTFLSDIYSVMNVIINSRLIVLERKLKGVLPNPDNIFSDTLSKKELESLRKMDIEFNERFPLPVGNFPVFLDTLTKTGAWYKYLDSHYSKSVRELSKRTKDKKGT